MQRRILKGRLLMKSQRHHKLGGTLGLGCMAILLFAATSCKKKTPPPPPASPTADPGAISQLSNTVNTAPQARHIAGGENVSVAGGTDSYAHVTYNDNVKFFDESEVRASLMGISSDGHGWVFQNAPASIKALKAGDVFMVKGQLAAKVVGAVTQGDKTLIETGEASLRDLVQSGDIKLDAPVRFHGPKAAADKPRPRSLFDLLIPPVYAAQSGLQGSSADAARAAGTADAAKQVAQNAGSYFLSGWTVSKWNVTPSDGQANFELVMAKSQGGFVAMIGMKGWIGDFDLTSNLQMNASAPKQLYQAAKNTKGFIQFDWEIAKSSPGVWATQDRVKLPAGMSVPLAPLLGGMPLTLDISSALQIHPALTGGNEYSRGGFSVNWGGGAGMQSSSGGAVQDGSTMAGTYNITQDQSISPIAPNAMVISYCAPRIELRLDVLGTFSEEVSSFASNIDKIASTLESLLPQAAQDLIANSPLSKMTASNVLTSNADVYIQFIATEGTTHASNITPVPCSKQEIKFDIDAGTAAQFFGLTSGASASVNLYTHTYTHWAPASDFCKSV
jgi:hypothetical protein